MHKMLPSASHLQQKLNLDKYLNSLFGYAMVLTRGRPEAQDLVQETCLRALRGIDGLRDSAGAKSWLFTILRNVWFNELRHRRRAPEIVRLDLEEGSRDEPVDAAQNPHTEYVADVERQQVQAAIQSLPIDYREIIIMREYEELSYQEIAAILNCPPGTVMSRLARARSRLRDLLSEEFVPQPRKTIAGRTGGSVA